MRPTTGLSLAIACWVLGARAAGAQALPSPAPHPSGAELYRAACATCHGPDGRGAPPSAVGRVMKLPDFTDCSFATPEADADWMAVVHEGGPARAFDRAMPAFTEALSASEIATLVGHLRSFCTDRGWPRGDLNLPRPLVTEKAFPENEAVLTTSVSLEGSGAVGNQFLYERRLGRRGQYEVSIPVNFAEGDGGAWSQGMGDLAAAYKHVLFDSLPHGSILSAGTELVLPTGSEAKDLGGGATVLEPFVTASQILPRDAFAHVHVGFELPIGADGKHDEVFWRVAVGKTYARGWGRAWSPMVEVLAVHEIGAGEGVSWDLAPQLQVSLSRRQHVLVNGGIRVPVNKRGDRSAALVTYLLWDWFDGGLFTGW